MSENEMMRRELQSARIDDPRYRSEAVPPAQHQHQQSHQHQSPSVRQHQQPATQGAPQGPYGSNHYANSSRTELPPLRAINNMHNAPESMTGVQYEPTGHVVNGNANGYR